MHHMKFIIYVVTENERLHTENKYLSLISSGLVLTDFRFPTSKKKNHTSLIGFAFISSLKDLKE